MKRTATTSDRQRRFRSEWLALVMVVLATVWWLSGSGHLMRLNGWTQDVISWMYRPVARTDIVIVAIDDRSVERIGRWPWRRALHAQLIDYISSGHPRAIGLDVLLTEPDDDYPHDDLLLARSLERSGRTVLPMIPAASAFQKASLPLPLFASAAAYLGHSQVIVDDDGIVRRFNAAQDAPRAVRPSNTSTNAAETTTQTGSTPHLALAMACAGKASRTADSSATTLSPPSPLPCHGNEALLQEHAESLHRPQQEHITYARAATRNTDVFPIYSYADVLTGTIPAAAFKNKYVLIGATATGLSRHFTAPVSTATDAETGDSRALTDVELLAYILNGNLDNNHLPPASDSVNRAINLTIVAIALIALAWRGPSSALLACAGLVVSAMALAVLSPRLWSIHIAPAAAILGVAIAYPLWSWLQLRAAADFLSRELDALRSMTGGGLFNRSATSTHPPLQRWQSVRRQFWGQRIEVVDNAADQLRALHRFIRESLLQLPSPTLVCDQQGRILLANAAAQNFAKANGIALTSSTSLPTLLASLRRTTNSTPSTPDRPVIEAKDFAHNALPDYVEACNASGQHLLLLSQVFRAEPLNGWLITLVDISALRQAQQQRDQAMQFVSHDMRVPVASIITLLEMQRNADSTALSGPSNALWGKVENYAQSALSMADDFVHLAKAQSQVLQWNDVDLQAVVDQAIDQVWPQAQAVHATVRFHPSVTAPFVQGDAALLRRAVTNLLINALKYGKPAGTDATPWVIDCAISELPTSTTHALDKSSAPHQWRITVTDYGPGIPPEALSRITHVYEQVDSSAQTHGVGLGLALVRVVAQRHRGSLSITSVLGQGSQFHLDLPGSHS